MKFFGKKSFSILLYWITSVCAIGIAQLFIFILVSLILNNFTVDASNQFSIAIPLTASSIKGDYSIPIFLGLILFLLFYGSFFYLLRSIFKSFSQENVIFTSKTINYIKKFAWLNIALPPLGIIAAYFIKNGLDFETVMQNGLLVVLGIFSLFVVAVFNEGIVLQEETDLTI